MVKVGTIMTLVSAVGMGAMAAHLLDKIPGVKDGPAITQVAKWSLVGQVGLTTLSLPFAFDVLQELVERDLMRGPPAMVVLE